MDGLFQELVALAGPDGRTKMLLNRISTFISLPMRSLDRLALQNHLDEIGRPLPKTA